jgi:Flp pilus assembly secretin CpaC
MEGHSDRRTQSGSFAGWPDRHVYTLYRWSREVGHSRKYSAGRRAEKFQTAGSGGTNSGSGGRAAIRAAEKTSSTVPGVSCSWALLEVDQEISNVVNADQQTLTPTIAQRRVHSTVSVVSGQTVLLGGLISERDQKSQSGIPGLREIKFIGDLLGNTSGTRTRSEIIVFIKTRLIRNGVDASAVTEEFRERLQSMRRDRTVINGTGARPNWWAILM